MIVDLNDYMIPSDYARLINKSVTWVNKLIADNKIRHIKHYGRLLVNVVEEREKDVEHFNAVVKDIESKRSRI